MSLEDRRDENEEALAHLDALDEELMTLAWGPGKTPEDRRRIVLAAVVFGREFERRMLETPPESLDEKNFQRFLMGLMNAAILGFAEREGMDADLATALLGNVELRDYILEFNEVLENFADRPETPLNEHFRAAVESRIEKARWADHWSSG